MQVTLCMNKSCSREFDCIGNAFHYFSFHLFAFCKLFGRSFQMLSNVFFDKYPGFEIPRVRFRTGQPFLHSVLNSTSIEEHPSFLWLLFTLFRLFVFVYGCFKRSNRCYNMQVILLALFSPKRSFSHQKKFPISSSVIHRSLPWCCFENSKGLLGLPSVSSRCSSASSFSHVQYATWYVKTARTRTLPIGRVKVL